MYGISFGIKNLTQNPLNTMLKGLSATTVAAAGLENHLKGVGNSATALKSKSDSAFGSMTGRVVQLGAAYASTQTVIDALGKGADLQSLENAIKFTGGAEGEKNLAFVRKSIDDLKLPVEAAMEGFKTLSGGLMGTGLTSKQTQDIFISTAQATTVMGLKADETKGALLALSQMASKGTVSAEELRGQLGERLPGAFGIAARAMGVTQERLGKMLEQGTVQAATFLPKFAEEMKKTFAGGVPDALNSARSNFNAFNNALYDVQTAFAQAVMPAVTNFLKGYLIPSLKWIKDNAQSIKSWTMEFWQLGKAVLVGYGVFKAITIGVAAYNAVAFIASNATTIWTLAQTYLNLALTANPIGIVIVAIATLAAGVTYAWGRFAGFRGFLTGMWETIKVFGGFIYDFAIRPLAALGEILYGIFTRDFAMVKSGLANSVEALKANVDNFMNAGQKLGTAFTEGYNKGAAQLDVKQGAFFSMDKTVSPKPIMAQAKASPDLGIGKKGKGGSEVNGGNNLKNINVTIQKLVEKIEVNTTKEGNDSSYAKVKEMVVRALMDATNDFQYQ